MFLDASDQLLLWRDEKPMKHEDEVHMKRGSAGLALDESHVILLFLLLGDYLVITSNEPQKMDHTERTGIHEQRAEHGPASLMKSKPSLCASNNKNERKTGKSRRARHRLGAAKAIS